MTEHDVKLPPSDGSLWRVPELPFQVELPIMGIATRFETNSRSVFELVNETFGCWRRADSNECREEVRVRIVVRDGTASSPERAPVRHFCPDATRLVIVSSDSVAISDPERREAVAFVTDSLVADGAHFRVAILEALVLALLSHFDRHPLHAAAIARGNRVVLLAGPSGAGKSTLAYLAHSAGYEVMAEDHVRIQLEPVVRVWAAPVRIRLVSSATRHFPETASLGAPITLDGKTKHVVDLLSRHRMPSPVDEVVVCLLGRSDGPPRLERIDAHSVAAGLGNVAPGFDRFPERHTRVVARLAAAGGWCLRLSEDPRDALGALETMLAP